MKPQAEPDLTINSGGDALMSAGPALEAAQPQTTLPARQQRQKKNGGKSKKRKRWIVVVLLLVVVAVLFFVLRGMGSAQPTTTDADYTVQTVERRNITASLTGSGTLQAADSYTLTTLISGEILAAPFEEGDIVEKDQLLYEVDDGDMASSLEQSQLSLSQSQRNYSRKLESKDDLNVKAPASGTIVQLDVKVGDNVTANQTIGTIRNQGVMSLTLPFASDDAVNLSVGQTATVILDGSFETLTGVISKINATDEVLAGNRLVRQVTIDVENPGGISTGQNATAMVGSIACSSSGSFDYESESTISANTSGKVQRILADEGDSVTKDATILVLSSDTLDDDIANAADSVRNAQISLEKQTKQITDYTITSPIAGTIVEKYYKEGDTLESGKTLCTIFDLSYLTMTLNVDELDISSVEVGQTVTVTADAVSGNVYTGVVTKININGTTNNGVTSYPVTIRIDETDGLLPGMNADATIITENKENVLAVPSGAILRGNRVLVQTASGTDTTTDGSATDGQTPQGFDAANPPEGFDPENMPEGFDPENMPEGFDPENMPQRGEGQGGTRPGSADGSTVQANGSDNTDGATVQVNGSGNTDGAPAGFEYRQVEIGVSDDYYTEIISGLEEGESVAVYDSTGEMEMMPYMMMNGGMMSGGSTNVVVMESGPGGGGSRPAGGPGM